MCARCAAGALVCVQHPLPRALHCCTSSHVNLTAVRGSPRRPPTNALQWFGFVSLFVTLCTLTNRPTNPTLHLQIPLNEEDQHVGGKLVFVTGRGLRWPRRPAGSATVHCNRMVHGVSQLERGVRYGLFLVRKV